MKDFQKCRKCSFIGMHKNGIRHEIRSDSEKTRSAGIQQPPETEGQQQQVF